MKVFVITLALAGLVSAATADAQMRTNRLPTTSRGTVDGSWYVVGRDGNGNTIYERRTQDQYGNIIVQRARRDGNGNMSIISSQTVSNTNNRNGNNCDYNRTTNSVSDILFGRSGNANCDNRSNRVDGGWYQVGQDRNGNTIYERRTRDSNGNVIVQRARRDAYGNMSIISTRRASNSNGARNGRSRGDDQGDDENGRSRGRNNHDDGNYNDNNGQNGDHQDGNSVYRGDDNSYRNNNAKGRGRGRDNGKGKHKGND